MGATRRLNHYDVAEWQPLFVIAFVGAMIIFAGLGVQLLQLFVSIKNRKINRDVTGDPWNGRSFEWSTTSPPPFYNFAHTPEVEHRDQFWIDKHQKMQPQKKVYHDIHMPSNTATGFYIGVFSFLFGFAAVWYMTWLVYVSAIGIIGAIIAHLYQKHTEYNLPAAEIEKIELKGQQRL
jgi:cytochrome o ubiquinol oxidase subunit 1